MTKLIAETAWHHEGDFSFMTDLVGALCEQSAADIVKMHITLDLDAYMSRDHAAYDMLKSWMFTAEQWESLIGAVKRSGKQLMLLLNDTQAVEFAGGVDPDMVELHSVCLNVPPLQRAFLERFGRDTLVVIGVGGCSLEEVDAATHVFADRELVLMFGFQNYPTKYRDINLRKIRKIQATYAGKRFGYADHTA
ncbi:MAG: N-acetylneuraminate synthase family protein, partial [Mariprofundales bacterium]|nr:N-acetylneuraminate synthase family protein [Mariprofundales bacterium]